MGHDETEMDEFFDFEQLDSFFILKEDLVKYLQDAEAEYKNPSRKYRSDISLFYEQNVALINDIKQKLIKLSFKKKYDNQNRYYIVLHNNKDNRNRYSLLRDICLPRFTIITFVKLQEVNSKKTFIYLKPVFYIDPNKKEVKQQKELEKSLITVENKQKHRERQTKYRLELLRQMPACLITGVADERILIACHVKPYKDCDSIEEKFDTRNGIILTPTYHLLFDIGFISFSKEGKLLVSPFLSNLNKSRLNLKEGNAYRLQSGTEKYMKYHREKIFNTYNEAKFNELDITL